MSEKEKQQMEEQAPSPPLSTHDQSNDDDDDDDDDKANHLQPQQQSWQWKSYTPQDLKRTVVESTDSAIRSARFLHQNSSTHLRTLQDIIPKVKYQYKSYEDIFFKKVKDELMSAREHPATAVGVAVATGLLLRRGTRRLLFRHTVGRFQSEKVLYNKAERKVDGLKSSVGLMKAESEKLLERVAFAEAQIERGHTKIMDADSDIQKLIKSVYKIESQTTDLMHGLRQIPGREALELRAKVASMASLIKQQRIGLDRRVVKISDLGVPLFSKKPLLDSVKILFFGSSKDKSNPPEERALSPARDSQLHT